MEKKIMLIMEKIHNMKKYSDIKDRFVTLSTDIIDEILEKTEKSEKDKKLS